jgi:hypothetical protein
MTQAMKLFGSMDQEQLEAMSRSFAAGPGQAGEAPALDAEAAMASMLNNPESAKMVKSMMAQMTPHQLAAMSEASGRKLTPEQVHG